MFSGTAGFVRTEAALLRPQPDAVHACTWKVYSVYGSRPDTVQVRMAASPLHTSCLHQRSINEGEKS